MVVKIYANTIYMLTMSYSYVNHKMFTNEIAPILQVIFNSHSTEEYTRGLICRFLQSFYFKIVNDRIHYSGKRNNRTILWSSRDCPLFG